MLRSVILALVIASGAATARAQTNGALSIELSGLEPQGAVMVQLFNSEAGYRGGEAIAAQRVAVSAATAQVAFADLAPGRYAFRLFHDLNGDGEMNTNPFGMPTEPYAFSNNARGSFGPADWAHAAFSLSSGANTQQINVGGR